MQRLFLGLTQVIAGKIFFSPLDLSCMEKVNCKDIRS